MDTPKVGDLTEYELTPADTTLVDAGETVTVMVTDADQETGIFGGYAFLPGGAGIPYVRVDPSAPEPVAPGITSAQPTLSDLVDKVKNDSEFVEFLAWKDAQAAAQAPQDDAPEDPAPPAPVPDSTAPAATFDPGTPPASSTQQGE